MYEGLEDEELMRLYVAGKEAAFRELYDRYRGRVYGFILKRVHDPRLAEELFQATFLRLHRFRPSYTPGRLFSAWIFTICRNVVRDHFREEKRKPPKVSYDDGTMDQSKYIVPQEKELVDEVLSLLSKRQREVIQLRYENGLEFEEIGRALETSEENVRQLVSRAIRKMKEKIAR